MTEGLGKRPEYPESKEALHNKDLAQVWSNLVLEEKEAVPSDIETFSDDELREWLYQSVLKEAGDLAQEWDLVPDEELVNKLKKEDEPDKKATLELQYIQDCQQRFKKFEDQIKTSKDKSDKWDLWPARMKQRGRFNCSGAALLGTYLLDHAGIKSVVGNPSGHVVNVAYLSDGRTYYIDFRNNTTADISQSETTEIAGVKTLKVKDENIDFELLPVYSKEYNVAFLLENLDSLKDDAASKKEPKSDDERASLQEAREYMALHKEQMNSLDFQAWLVRLYKPSHDVSESKDMKQEAKRLKIMEKYEYPKRAKDYRQSLSPEAKMALDREAKQQILGIRELMYKDNKQILSKVSKILKEFLEIYYEEMQKLKEKNPDLFNQIIERALSELKRVE